MTINIQETVDKLYMLLEKLEKQENETVKLAEKMGCKPEEVQNMHGDHQLTPILVAQAQVLDSIIRLTIDRT